MSLAAWQIEEDEKKLAAAVTEDEKKLLWSGIRHLKEKEKKGGVDVTLKSQIFHLGELDMVTVPGELFSTFGLRLKEHMKGKMGIVWGYANYSAGYIVEKDEFGKGYESMSTPFPPGEAEKIHQTTDRGSAEIVYEKICNCIPPPAGSGTEGHPGVSNRPPRHPGY